MDLYERPMAMSDQNPEQIDRSLAALDQLRAMVERYGIWTGAWLGATGIRRGEELILFLLKVHLLAPGVAAPSPEAVFDTMTPDVVVRTRAVGLRDCWSMLQAIARGDTNALNRLLGLRAGHRLALFTGKGLGVWSTNIDRYSRSGRTTLVASCGYSTSFRDIFGFELFDRLGAQLRGQSKPYGSLAEIAKGMAFRSSHSFDSNNAMPLLELSAELPIDLVQSEYDPAEQAIWLALDVGASVPLEQLTVTLTPEPRVTISGTDFRPESAGDLRRFINLVRCERPRDEVLVHVDFDQLDIASAKIQTGAPPGSPILVGALTPVIEARRQPDAAATASRPPSRRRASAATGGSSEGEPERVPGYATDKKADRDLLGIERDIRALAALAASTEVRPPLSIGLFGPWGSGKTTFMHLLQQRIDALCAAERSRGGRDIYCSRVAHVWFNAWTYMDANLWASLASEVFQELGRLVDEPETGKPGESDSSTSRRGQLARALASAQEELSEANEEKRRAERSAEAAKKELESSVAARESVAARLGEATKKSAAVQEALRVARRALGEPFSDSARAIDLLKDIARESRGAWGLLCRFRVLCRRLATGEKLFAVALLAVLPLAVHWAASHLDMQWVGEFGAGLGFILTLGGEFLLWIRPKLRKLDGAISALEDAGEEIEAADQRLVERMSAKEAEIAAELALAREKVQAAQVAQADAQRKVELLAAEIQDIESGRVLDRFVRKRLAAGDYEKRRGLIALVRSDFLALEKLVREQPKIARVDRIVLYVDDLDRCPAPVVAEVLQAVHLLLALPLFVVVVGVDARWVGSSLAQHPGAIAPGGEPDGEAARSGAIRYLEKIFQIPYTLRELEPAGFERIIGNITENVASPAASITPLVAPPPVIAAPTVIDCESAGEVGVAPSPLVETAAAAQPEAQITARLTADDSPSPLRLEPHQIQFLKSLAPLIATPRAAKRLANLYRFLYATLTAGEAAAFADPLGDEYKAAAILLAALCGYPAEADQFLVELEEAEKDVTWSAFLQSDRTEARASHLTRALLKELGSGGDDSLANAPVSRFQEWIPATRRFSFGIPTGPDGNGATAHVTGKAGYRALPAFT